MLFDEKLSKEDIKKIKKVAVDLLDSKTWQISAFLGIGEIVKLLGVIVKMYLFVETIPPWEYNKNEIFMQMKRGVGI